MCDCDQKTVAVSLVSIVIIGCVVGLFFILKKPPAAEAITEPPPTTTAAPLNCETNHCKELAQRYNQNSAPVEACSAGLAQRACDLYTAAGDVIDEIEKNMSKSLMLEIARETSDMSIPQITVHKFWARYTGTGE